jgi:NDP-sugar pyrophosphorylase family protein
MILAGGLGIRISAETSHRPKPLIGIRGGTVSWQTFKPYPSSL